MHPVPVIGIFHFHKASPADVIMEEKIMQANLQYTFSMKVL